MTRWVELESVNAARQKGGRALPRPYLSLQDVSAAFDPRESRGFAHINPDKWPILTDWCQKYGLLGLFFVEARQVDLYPRWDSRLLGTEVEGGFMADNLFTYTNTDRLVPTANDSSR